MGQAAVPPAPTLHVTPPFQEHHPVTSVILISNVPIVPCTPEAVTPPCPCSAPITSVYSPRVTLCTPTLHTHPSAAPTGPTSHPRASVVPHSQPDCQPPSSAGSCPTPHTLPLPCLCLLPPLFPVPPSPECSRTRGTSPLGLGVPAHPRGLLLPPSWVQMPLQGWSLAPLPIWAPPPSPRMFLIPLPTWEGSWPIRPAHQAGSLGSHV